MDKIILRKKGLVESVIHQLKNRCQIEHSRHRNPLNFLVNVIGGLIACSLQPQKSCLNLRKSEQNLLKMFYLKAELALV